MIQKQQMFTIRQIKNSSFYLKNVFLYISIKIELAKKYSQSLQSSFCIKIIFSKSAIIILYKDNLKSFWCYVLVEPLYLLWVIEEKDYYCILYLLFFKVWRTLSIYLLLPGSWQCYKFLINYILGLHVKSFILARWDHSFLVPGSCFTRTKFSHGITSVHLGRMKKLTHQFEKINRSTFH